MAVRSRVINAPPRALARPRVRLPAGSLLTLLAYALALLALLVALQAIVTWGQRRLDDARYGFPRRTVVQGLVGHGDADGLPSTITALNLDGQIVVIELPGDDAQKAVVLPAPFLVGRDGAFVVPRLALEDMNGDGHVDLLLTLDGEMVVYTNRDGAFQPPASTQAPSSAGGGQ
jgi:hypothetical protein